MFSLVWQKTPVYPLRHRQENEQVAWLSMQYAEFWHGLELHGLLS